MEVNSTSQQETTPRRVGIGQGKGTRRQYTNRRGSSGHVSPAIVEKHLAGTHFPSERATLLSTAEKNDAPSDVIALLKKLPEKTYTSPIDITKEIGKIK